jgi:uncharacterized protein YqhQ
MTMTSSAAGPRQPYIGGQAVIEGVMMRSPASFVVAVRRFGGGIAIREQAWGRLLAGFAFLRWPVFRGALVLAESLHNGFSALKFSSDHGLPPEEPSTKKPRIGLSALLGFMLLVVTAVGQESPGAPEPPGAAVPQPPLAPAPRPQLPKKDSQADAVLLLATLVMVVFFIGLPHLLTWLVGRALGPGWDTSGVWFHLVDGVMRVLVLVGYMWVLSKTKDARRLFEYHGAEHKAIWTYESYKPLKVDEARGFTTRHPRCGTSFLFIVVGVAVLLHVAILPLIPRLHPSELVNQLLLVLIKIPMAFPIAGLAYELQRWSARESCPAFIKALTRPGIWLQTITTIEPAVDQLEIALLSLDRALAREDGRPRSAEGVTLYASFEEAAATP